MLIIAHYQRVENQNYNEVSYQSEWPLLKNLQRISAGESVEKRECACIVSGNEN